MMKTIYFYLNYINKDLHLEKKFYHLKLRYTDPCNFLTKRALMIQRSKLVVAKDSKHFALFEFIN